MFRLLKKLVKPTEVETITEVKTTTEEVETITEVKTTTEYEEAINYFINEVVCLNMLVKEIIEKDGRDGIIDREYRYMHCGDGKYVYMPITYSPEYLENQKVEILYGNGLKVGDICKIPIEKYSHLTLVVKKVRPTFELPYVCVVLNDKGEETNRRFQLGSWQIRKEKRRTVMEKCTWTYDNLIEYATSTCSED